MECIRIIETSEINLHNPNKLSDQIKQSIQSVFANPFRIDSLNEVIRFNKIDTLLISFLIVHLLFYSIITLISLPVFNNIY